MVRSAVLLLLAVTAQAADRYDWKQGKVAGMSVDPPLTSVNAVNYPSIAKNFTYTISDGDASYQARHKARKAAAALDSTVEYSITGKHLYIRDSKGKVHKLTRVRSTIRCPGCMKSRAIA